MGNITEASHRIGWPDFSVYRPQPSAATLSAWLRESQAFTDTLFSVIDAGRLSVPKIRIVNPPLWEIGHVGWFQEFWIQRRDPLTDELAYFAQLSILHQDMHNEAFCYMWHTLGYPAPLPLPQPAARGAHEGAGAETHAGDIEIPRRRMVLGAAPESGFVFDNEK